MGDIHERLAKNMRLLRRERKLSQEALAHEADLHRTYVSDLERCARNPSISAIDKLARALGVSCGQLLD
jgi:transcriptional regulator with XRE-family HTH domain